MTPTGLGAGGCARVDAVMHGIVVFAADVAFAVFVAYPVIRMTEAMESYDECNDSDRHSERP